MATTSSRARAGSFIGRAKELSALEDLVRSGEQAVIYVHGIAGIGKSALVSALVERLEAGGAAVEQLDCRTIEPSERGLLAALGADEVEALQHGGGTARTSWCSITTKSFG